MGFELTKIPVDELNPEEGIHTKAGAPEADIDNERPVHIAVTDGVRVNVGELFTVTATEVDTGHPSSDSPVIVYV